VKKNKIILLTVLIMLVVYCGIVIFITKPNTFAFSGILGDYNTISGTNKAQLMEEIDSLVDEKIDAAMNDRMVSYVDSTIFSAESRIEEQLKVQAEVQGEAQIVANILSQVQSQLDSMANAIVQEAVEKQVSKVFDDFKAKLVEEKDVIVNEILAQIKDSLLAVKSEVLQYLSSDEYIDFLISELMKYEGDLASSFYTSYKDSLIASLTPSIVDAVMENISVSLNKDFEQEISKIEATNPDGLSVEEMNAIVAVLKDNLDIYAPYIAEAVLPELEKNLDTYLPCIVDAVLKALPQTEASSIADEISSMSEEDYYTLREKIRRNAIEELLSQLQD